MRFVATVMFEMTINLRDAKRHDRDQSQPRTGIPEAGDIGGVIGFAGARVGEFATAVVDTGHYLRCNGHRRQPDYRT